MSSEYTLDDVVTDFLLNTCRVRRQPNIHVVQATMLSAHMTALHSDEDEDTEFNALTTGSVAEFYIEPMLPLIGDIDVMYCNNTVLVIPRGHTPPTQLPAEFHKYVKVLEICDCHLPGYVYLELRYLLTECIDDDKYSAVEYIRGIYFANNAKLTAHTIPGPALCFTGKQDMTVLSFDYVFCVRCLSWPPQTADWPTRQRNYGWPDSATVDRVVSNGCDVVAVAHRQCRQDKWLSEHQWRLSFSRAEIMLLNCWMPVQQIVYHVLRSFMKTERLTVCADNYEAGTLSNYHIKTLMLWACELKLRSWWTDDVNLVRMCVQLLHALANWLTHACCQHYFINNCNLIDISFNMTDIGDQLMSVNEMWLSMWFVDNYIQKCSQFTPYYISRLFDDVSTNVKLQNAVSVVVARRQNNLLFDLWKVFKSTEYGILIAVNTWSLTARSCVCYMTELAKID